MAASPSDYFADIHIPYDGVERRGDCGGRRAADLTVHQQVAIADALVAFADLNAGDSRDIAPLLELIEACRELVAHCEFTVLARDRAGDLHLLAASSDAARALDALQAGDQAGPSVQLLDRGEPIAEVDFQGDQHEWPLFISLARVLRFRRMYAVLLRSDTETIGVLDVFDRHQRGTSVPKLAWIQTLAMGAAVSVESRRAHAKLNDLAVQLQGALDSRVVIEQAKGFVASELAISVDEAFALLRTHARDHNASIREVSSAAISGRLSREALRP